MKKTSVGLAALALGGAIVLGAPVVPTDEPPDKFFSTVQMAQTHRRHLVERQQYYIANNFAQKHLDQAAYSIPQFEDFLIEKEFTTERGGELKQPPPKRETVLETIVGFAEPAIAYAFTFGKETFEDCGAIPCTFDSDASSGSGAMNLDATSVLNGTDSVRCDIAAGTSNCILRKTVSATEQWYQFYYHVPTGWTFGAGGYAGLMRTNDGVGSPVYCLIEDYGALRITCNGDEIGYTDTSVNIALNTDTRLEFRVRVSATVGDLDIWVNNTTEGSPSYNGSGTMNTGSDTITQFDLGGFHPDTVNDKWYDDVAIDSAFIGTRDGEARVINPPATILDGSIFINGQVYIH